MANTREVDVISVLVVRCGAARKTGENVRGGPNGTSKNLAIY